VLQRFDLSHGPRLIIAAKGIEQATGRFMNEVAEEVAPGIAALILSGPSFAADVVKGLPTAVTMAGPTFALAKQWGDALSLPQFRVYASDDVRGVEIGGALKNVLAIACGIADGRRLGDSARAALTTRGFAELTRFGRALGARPETLMGLSGLGDLLLTCSSRQSRNYSFGFALGEGETAAQAMAAARGVVEGAFTAAIAVKIAHDKGVDMPIAEAVDAIINRGSDPETEIARLLARPSGAEHR
jgi:glycerol-3-phosphate dehydrogenase (NAD(P)+)